MYSSTDLFLLLLLSVLAFGFAGVKLIEWNHERERQIFRTAHYTACRELQCTLEGTLQDTLDDALDDFSFELKEQLKTKNDEVEL